MREQKQRYAEERDPCMVKTLGDTCMYGTKGWRK